MGEGPERGRRARVDGRHREGDGAGERHARLRLRDRRATRTSRLRCGRPRRSTRSPASWRPRLVERLTPDRSAARRTQAIAASAITVSVSPRSRTITWSRPTASRPRTTSPAARDADLDVGFVHLELEQARSERGDGARPAYRPSRACSSTRTTSGAWSSPRTSTRPPATASATSRRRRPRTRPVNARCGRRRRDRVAAVHALAEHVEQAPLVAPPLDRGPGPLLLVGLPLGPRRGRGIAEIGAVERMRSSAALEHGGRPGNRGASARTRPEASGTVIDAPSPPSRRHRVHRRCRDPRVGRHRERRRHADAEEQRRSTCTSSWVRSTSGRART